MAINGHETETLGVGQVTRQFLMTVAYILADAKADDPLVEIEILMIARRLQELAGSFPNGAELGLCMASD